jgi:hypothetical protein
MLVGDYSKQYLIQKYLDEDSLDATMKDYEDLHRANTWIGKAAKVPTIPRTLNNIGKKLGMIERAPTYMPMTHMGEYANDGCC